MLQEQLANHMQKYKFGKKKKDKFGCQLHIRYKN